MKTMKKKGFFSVSVLFAAILIISFGCLSVSAGTGNISGVNAETTGSSGSGTQTQAAGVITSISYDGGDDEVIIRCSAEGTRVYVINVKKPEGCKATKKNVESFTSVNSKRGYETGTVDYVCAFCVAPSQEEKSTLSVPEGKAAYYYISTTEPVEKEVYTPNFTIEATDIKKLSVNLNFAAASIAECYPAEILPAVSSLSIKKTDGSQETYSYGKNPDTFKSILKKLVYGTYWQYPGEKWTEYEGVAYEEGSYAWVTLDRYPYLQMDLRLKSATFPDSAERLDFVYLGGSGECCDRVDYRYEDWEVSYDQSWGNKRVYSYTAHKGNTAESGISISLRGDSRYSEVYSGRDTKLIAATTASPSGSGEPLGGTNTFFTYHINDGISGFFTSDMQHTPEEYGITVDSYGYYAPVEEESASGEATSGEDVTRYSYIQWQEGDKICIVRKEARLPEDFGLTLWSGLSWNKGQRVDLPDYVYDNLIQGETKYSFVKTETFENDGAYLCDMMYEAACMGKGEKVSFIYAYMGSSDASSGKYVRTSKSVKVSIPTAGKAVKAKFDYGNEMISVKNGYDYRIEDGEWMTVLPFSKDGTAAKTTVPTSAYSPVKKAEENSAMFTASKIKGISVDDLLTSESGVTIQIRKSATVGKPASAPDENTGADVIDIAARGDAPLLKKAKEEADYLSVMDEKESFVLPSYDTSVEFASYGLEYMVMDKKDYEAELANPGILDKTSYKWAKYAPGKKITIGKTKSKYKYAASQDKAEDHTLAEDSYILVRRKVVKPKGKSTGVLNVTPASKCTVLKITTKTIDGKSAKVLVPVE